jgi:hypothetical protein
MDDIERINKLHKRKFGEIPYKDRAIFIPHCLRHPDCKAKTTEEGVICLGCGKCNISEFKKEAENLGYKLFIVPGFSLVKKLIEKHKPRAVMGVACNEELNEAIEANIEPITQLLPLLKDGCVNTAVDWKKLKEMIK